MVLYKATGKIFKDRKQAKQILGQWNFKKACWSGEIVYFDNNDESMLYGESIYNNTKNL